VVVAAVGAAGAFWWWFAIPDVQPIDQPATD